jgi:copper chaperone CopZ
MFFKNISSICFLFLFCVNVSAQVKDFGEVSPYDFSNYPDKYDSTESAVVLFDQGYSYFTYPSYECVFERHVRIKVINDKGLEKGEISLVFNKEIDQDINRIKANVYKLEGNKVVKTELDKDQIFEENLFGNIYVKKFVVPGLRKGSIFEYSYKHKIGSPFNLPDWKFHREIPVQLSEYRMKVPNNFLYHTILKGVDTVLVSNIEGFRDQTGRGNNITLTKKDIPAVKEIPFINSVDDFKTEVYNQLVYVNFTGSPSRKFNNTWEKVAKEIRSHPSIGKQRLNGDMKAKVDEIINGLDDPIEITRAIYAFVAENIEWDGRHFLYSDQGIRDTYSNKRGNSADINLMLHEMLSYADIRSDLAFLSTKDHGVIITNYPIIHQFNSVVVIVEPNDEEKYLLDATEGNRALNMPPIKDLYRYIFKIKDDSYSWLRSSPNITTSKTILIDQKIDSNGVVEAEISGTIGGYYAEILRDNEDKDMLSILNKNHELDVDSVEVVNFENVQEGIGFTINGKYENSGIKESAETVYIRPFSIIDIYENPFKASERLFPIYFPYTFKERIVVNLQVPSAYKVEDLPKPNLYKIGENQARIRFLSQNSMNKVTMMIDFSINEIKFSEDLYEPIKELFNSFQESQEYQIVLKKILE